MLNWLLLGQPWPLPCLLLRGGLTALFSFGVLCSFLVLCAVSICAKVATALFGPNFKLFFFRFLIDEQ